jgi:hypothetical protein
LHRANYNVFTTFTPSPALIEHSLLLKFAAVCSEPAFAILPVLFSGSSDIHDYLGLAESLLDKFGDALLAVPNLQARLRAELRN